MLLLVCWSRQSVSDQSLSVSLSQVGCFERGNLTEETFRLDVRERPQQVALKYRAERSAGGNM